MMEKLLDVLQRPWLWLRGAPDWKKKLWVSACFSFLFGYADAISYQRYRAFGAMMTGNVVLFGYSLVTFGVSMSTRTAVLPDCVYYAVINLAFFCGCVAYRLPNRRYGLSARLLAPVVLLVIVLEFVNNHGDDDVTLGAQRLRVAYLAFAFGMQNTMLVKGPIGRIPGILMTTNLVNAGDVFVTVLLQGRANVTREQQQDGLTILANMSSIILGAALGAYLQLFITDSCWLNLPIGVMLAIGFSFTDAILAPSTVEHDSPTFSSDMTATLAVVEPPYAFLQVEDLEEPPPRLALEGAWLPRRLNRLHGDEMDALMLDTSAHVSCLTPEHKCAGRGVHRREDSISSSASTAEPPSPSHVSWVASP
eukprot:TRINITY_DN7231_c0_g2_i1.p1 TRINITY_DN7231_c0_g2~~TRINITY_DN7231_c0_g2_i1.p1  ORF type:complete len:364 (+),score=36.33 TRINITY_DN7231_c0_g2_i1:123-1214(+)